MLPTNKKATINEKQIVLYRKLSSFHDDDIDKPVGSLLISKRFVPNSECYLGQHLYITSDDETKKGDYGLSKLNEIVRFEKNFDPKLYKKIIATTNSSLKIAREDSDTNSIWKIDGALLPQPSQSFIEKYIIEYNTGNIITDVMVEYGYTVNKSMGHFHQEREYFLKVNSKDNTITIRKTKTSWSREEVDILCRKAFLLYKSDDTGYPGVIKSSKEKEDKWIEENL